MVPVLVLRNGGPFAVEVFGIVVSQGSVVVLLSVRTRLVPVGRVRSRLEMLWVILGGVSVIVRVSLPVGELFRAVEGASLLAH